MNINLKQLHYQINTLDMVVDDLKHKRFVGTTGATVNDLAALLKLLEEIKKDLRGAGESIVELDLPRSEAIKAADGA
jgi:hypothetical protein